MLLVAFLHVSGLKVSSRCHFWWIIARLRLPCQSN